MYSAGGYAQSSAPPQQSQVPVQYLYIESLNLAINNRNEEGFDFHFQRRFYQRKYRLFFFHRFYTLAYKKRRPSEVGDYYYLDKFSSIKEANEYIGEFKEKILEFENKEKLDLFIKIKEKKKTDVSLRNEEIPIN